MIIGLSGNAGAGKDTCGAIISRVYGFKRTAFADPMKSAVKDFFDFSHDQMWGPSEMRNKPDPRWQRADGTYLTPRFALQLLGTQFGRACHEDVWVRLTLRRAREFLTPDPLGQVDYTGVVITDVRFKNEIAAIKAAGGLVVRVKREVTNLVGAAAMHPSELEQRTIPDTEFDYVLENNFAPCENEACERASIEELEARVTVMMNTLRGSR